MTDTGTIQKIIADMNVKRLDSNYLTENVVWNDASANIRFIDFDQVKKM